VDQLFLRAFQADPKSAFGGIVATNQAIDAACARKLVEFFLEVILAPQFTAEALEILKTKKNLRLIEWPEPRLHQLEIRSALGGWLLQDRDDRGKSVHFTKVSAAGSDLTVELLHEIEGAWKICKHVRSNAIVLTQNQATLGIGAGQVSRVDSMRLALDKAKPFLKHAVLASDAFFPFRDSIDLLKGLSIAAIVQPGGSQRDSEVIEACNELGLPLFFTGERHFKH
jgi:phosphoribosylaminoimidazolecarboxamide formyltransferase/IMP cyclohydrolase